MSTDIRLVRLCRKTIDRAASAAKETYDGNRYFLTDYFDTMYVEKKEVADSFANIMGIGIEYDYENETTVQGYTLYCSEEMIERYENNPPRIYRKDAFAVDASMKNLGIIYTYISPETMARMAYSIKEMWNEEDGIIMQPFLDDIYAALDSFHNEYENDIFVARVYIMLSAGDFAVVIRSKMPETIYRIATYLRKREAGVKSGEKIAESSFVLYKTYTLLAMEADAWEQKADNETSENRFIVRGCYSNSYWRDQDEIKCYLDKRHKDNTRNQNDAKNQDNTRNKNYIKGLQRLNGRYDFSVQITEQEFWELMPSLVAVKQGIPIHVQNGQKDSSSDIVRYIKYLIENRYLSYINERYLLADMYADIGRQKTDISQSVLLKTELVNTEYSRLFDSNKEKVKELLKLQEKAAEEAQKIRGYRKKINQYIWMLKKQIMMCQGINELSDVRIYAEILMEQIETVLRTALVYIRVCGEYGNGADLDFLEASLRRAVTTIDCYAGYIRNNNMQALQTPNYNIESAAGMEKILIGYSEWLWKLTGCYHYTTQRKEEKKEFLPVVVPDIQDQEVNVEVLFPDGNAEEWEVERKVREEIRRTCKGYEIEKYFMIIGSTTLDEISNVPVMITALAHEIAHQFRYESREDRNKTLMNVAVQKYMEGVAQELANYIEADMGEIAEENIELRQMLSHSLSIAYMKYWEGEQGQREEMMHAPLQIFGRMLKNDLQNIIEAWRSEEKLWKRIEDYIKELHYNAVFEGSAYQEKLAELRELREEWEDFINGKGTMEAVTMSDRLTKWAFEIAWLVAWEVAGISEAEKEEKYRMPVITSDTVYQREWEKVYGESSSKDIKRIYREFYRFSCWMVGYTEKSVPQRQNAVALSDRLDIFRDTFYEEMKNTWENTMEQTKNLYDYGETEISQTELLGVPTYHYWNRIGRCLGLSQRDKTWFLEYVKKGVMDGDGDSLQLFIKLYREETADLFMCNIMNMEAEAYVNLAASLFIKNAEYRQYDIERLFRVLYVKWCCKIGISENESRMAYGALCCRLVQNTYLQFVKIWNMQGKPRCNLNEGEYQKITWNGGKGEEQDELLNTIEKIQSAILTVQKELKRSLQGEKKKEALEQLAYIMRIYDILWVLVADVENMASQLQTQTGMKEDLMRGISEQEELYTTWKNNKTDMEIQIIASIGEEISKELKNIDAFIGLSKNTVLNKKCIELLVKLYYSNKIRNSQTNIKRGRKNED